MAQRRACDKLECGRFRRVVFADFKSHLLFHNIQVLFWEGSEILKDAKKIDESGWHLCFSHARNNAAPIIVFV